ncbi:MAG: carbohydrate binding family 9 domain-containing protein [Bacteroidales bacterium]|nr:carbohydrate binding family 9 domain-containing protein [Bacteroidales bacterium]
MKKISRIIPGFSILLIQGLLFLAPLNVCSQEPMAVPRLPGELFFDGVPDEEAWQKIAALPLVMHMPVYGNEPTELSVIKIAYDNDYLYVSGIINYKNPDNIRAFSKKRDYNYPKCDWLGIVIDTFYDRQNAVMFWTNPNGLRSEGTIQNDAVDASTDMSFSWNTFWDVKSSITENGWSTEIRIPFSSLRFQVKENKTCMGITIENFRPAKSEMSSFPPIPPDVANATWKPSLTRMMEFTGLKPKNPVYVTPYITGGIGQLNELNDSETGYAMDSKFKFDAGFDAKYSITNNLTVDLTVNTDFAQVEADDQKINLTRYSLYFPEKRVFFQEKSDVFDFSFLGGNNLFYSRRIGLYDGYPVRIFGGVRMTGRINKWDIGILDMQTASFKENPSENFGIFRTKRSVFNPSSYIGGMATSRLGMNGSYNVAYGLDGQFRVIGDEFMTVKWAQTFERGSVNKIFDLAPSRFLFEWQRRKIKGFGYDFVYTWSGKSFNPGVGFEVKDNYQGVRAILQHGWLPQGETFLRYHSISLTTYYFRNTLTGLHETTSGLLKWSFEAKKGFSGNIAANWFLEDLADTIILGNDQASVPPGRYSFSYLSAAYSSSVAHALSYYLSAEAGSFYDGWKLSFYALPLLSIGAGFDLGLTYYFDYVNLSLSESFINHILGVRGLLTMTTKTSLSAYIQYNTAIDKVVTNIRFRYNPREGNDFYIVYDEGLNSNLVREVPRLPLSAGRTVLLKYTYTFMF